MSELNREEKTQNPIRNSDELKMTKANRKSRILEIPVEQVNYTPMTSIPAKNSLDILEK